MIVVLRATLLIAGMLWTVGAVVVVEQADFERPVSWVTEPGLRGSNFGDTQLVRNGTIRTSRLYSDFVLRFDFRLSEPSSEGRLFVRSRFGYGNSATVERGYQVALTNRVDGKDALGRVSAAAVGMQEVTFARVQSVRPATEWQACEVHAERDQLSVRVNGEAVSTVHALDEFAGYIALQSTRGNGIEFRNLQIKRLPPSQEPFGQDAHRVSEPGIEAPRAVKSAQPFYPREPHDAGVQGTVVLEVVVEATGLIGDVRVLKSVHPDLDESAIASARRWRFDPGQRSGQPVAVIATMEVEFRRSK